MKRGKRVAAVALAIGMAVTGSMASFAANEKDLAESDYGGVTDGKVDSVIEGTIKITSIQVKVPIKASFDIDPNVTVAADAAVVTSAGADNNNQIIAQASNYTITNTSKVPLVVSITGVKTKTGATEDTPELVNTLNGLTGKNVMFAICKKGDVIKYPSAAADNTGKWMTKTTVTTGSPYQIAASDGANILAPAGTLEMTICGATGAGWKNGEKFQVIPTFTVALQSVSS